MILFIRMTFAFIPFNRSTFNATVSIDKVENEVARRPVVPEDSVHAPFGF